MSEDLPEKMREDLLKELKGYKAMLYVVDMVNGFVNEGTLHDKHIRGTIPEQIKLIQKMKEENQGVSFIKECHQEDSVEFKTFPRHCVEGTSEAMLVPELQLFEKDSLVYLKNSTSAMFAPYMMEDLDRLENLEEVIISGCCTDICDINFAIPLKNYFNQLNRDVVIFAVKNAMDTYHIPGVHDREEYTNMAYKLMELAGIILVNDINELEKMEQKMGLGIRKVRR